MTKEEARQKIFTILHDDWFSWTPDSVEALQMAMEALQEPKQPDSVGTTDDLISRRAAIEAMCSVCGNDCDKSKFVYDAPQWEQVILCPEHYALTSLSSVQSYDRKLAKVLANTLDGTPLLYPCDKLWSKRGWCEGHCKPGQQEPDAECWMRYAEVMASDIPYMQSP